MTLKNSLVTTKPIWTKAVVVCWTFARCCGETGGLLRATTLKKARTRFNPKGAAMRWNWQWISRAWVAVVEASADLADDAERLAEPMHRVLRPARAVDSAGAAVAGR